MLNIPLMVPTKGRGMIDGLETHAPHRAMKKIWEMPKERRAREPFKPDGVLTFSKENSVGYSGTAHESDQQPHLKVADTNVCSTDSARDYGNPC